MEFQYVVKQFAIACDNSKSYKSCIILYKLCVSL